MLPGRQVVLSASRWFLGSDRHDLLASQPAGGLMFST